MRRRSLGKEHRIFLKNCSGQRDEAAAASRCGRGVPGSGGCGRGRLALPEGESVILCDAANVGSNREEDVENNSRL